MNDKFLNWLKGKCSKEMVEQAWRKRKYKVQIIKSEEDDGWTTVHKEIMNIVEVLVYMQKIIGLHDDAYPDGDNIESLMWEEDGKLYSLVVGDPEDPDF